MSECQMILCAELGGTPGTEPRKPTFARAGRTWGTPSRSESKAEVKLRPLALSDPFGQGRSALGAD
jgi:hypothetical protein